MKKAVLIAFLLNVGVSSSALADNDREKAISEFSADVLSLYSISGSTRGQLIQMNPKAQTYAVERIIKQAQKLNDKWKNNPYIDVVGFKLTGREQLGIDIDFKFKE